MANEDEQQPPVVDVGAQALAQVQAMQAQLDAVKVLQREATIKSEVGKLKGPQFKVSISLLFFSIKPFSNYLYLDISLVWWICLRAACPLNMWGTKHLIVHFCTG